MCQVALCFSLGADFLGFSVRQGKVLFVTFEGGKTYLLERIEGMVQALFPDRASEALGNVGVVDLKGAGLDRGVGDLTKLVQTYTPRYAILDPIDLALMGDYSNPTVARSCMHNLIGLAESQQMGIVASTHSRKHVRGTFDDIIGSKLWIAMAAAVIRLEGNDREGRLIFELRYGPPLRDINIAFDDKGYFVVKEPVLKERERATEAIIQALRTAGGRMLLKELRQVAAAEAGVHQNTVDAARHQLEQEGKISCLRIPGSAAKEVVLNP